VGLTTNSFISIIFQSIYLIRL